MSARLSARLLLALREDAARAATVLARLTAPEGSAALVVTPEDIRFTTRTDRSCRASVRHPLPGLGTWGGDDGCESPIDALASLVERTTEAIGRRGGIYLDVLERAESDAEAVDLYRTLVAEGLRGIAAALGRLDDVGESDVSAEAVDGLRQLLTIHVGGAS